MATIKLQSSDGEVFPTDVKIAKCSGTIRAMLEDAGMDGEQESIVPLPKVNAAILRLVLKWADQHEVNSIYDEEGNVEGVSSWAAFSAKIDQGTLFELISAAKYLDIEGLLHITCKTIADMIEDKSTDDLRKLFNIKNDLNPEDEEEEERGAISSEQISTVMKVPVDDWEEIFDYISLKDLNSMAKTCKRLKMIAGWYFKTFHSDVQIHLDERDDELYIGDMDQFYEHITSLEMDGTSEFIEAQDLEPFRFIATNTFNSLKSIRIDSCTISCTTSEAIEDILSRIEYVYLDCCIARGDFYENFLKRCVNLRTLKIHSLDHYKEKYSDDYYVDDEIDERRCDWMFHNYPTLEHIEFSHISYHFPIFIGMGSFLELNPNLKTLTMDYECFDSHWHILKRTDCRLDTLEISLDQMNLPVVHLASFIYELNTLYDAGFYQRLHLNLDKQFIESPVFLAVRLDDFHAFRSMTFNCSISSSQNVELLVDKHINPQKMNVSAKECVVLSVLRHFPALRELGWWGQEDAVDLPTLNAERQKVVGATKVTISVEENTYLATKRKFGDKHFSFIEIKRYE